MKTLSARVLVSLLSLAGIAIVLLVTADGVGITPNSVTYVTSAQFLLEGLGLHAVDPERGHLAPMTIHAPAYPVVLAAVGLSGMKPETAARWLNALLFGANILVVGLIVARATDSAWRPVLASFFFFLSTNTIELHSFAWSEPLFILLCLTGLWMLVRYMERDEMWILCLGAVCLAGMTMVRYAGAAIVAGAAISLLVNRHRPWARRFAEAVLLLAVTIAPLVAWMIRNALSGAMAGRKPISFHPFHTYHLDAAIHSISALVFPARAPDWSRALVALGVVGVFTVMLGLSAAMVRSGRWPLRRSAVTRVLGTAIVSYAIFYVLYVSFVDWSLTLTGRILAPLFALGVVQIFSGYAPGERGRKDVPAIRKATLAVMAILCLFMVARVGRLAGPARLGGFDYSLTRYEDSTLVREVRELPDDAVIYTNSVEFVYYLTGREAKGVPWKINKYSRGENALYREELDRMRNVLHRGKGVIIYIDNVETYFLPSEKELTRALDLKVLDSSEEGRILVSARESAPLSG